MRQLAAHIVASDEGFVASIRQGLAGSVEPSASPEQRQRRQAELEVADPTSLAHALRAVTAEFQELYAGLGDPQLEAICFHRRGNRSVRWYAAHRLAEVAFHSWDLARSLGQQPELAEQVAALLLPTLLESNAPRTYAAGLTPQRGRGERYLLVVDSHSNNDDSARWLVTIDPDHFSARRGGGPGDLAITGSAASLALLVYGRLELRDLAQSGAVRLVGDPALIDRFSLIFPRP